LLGRKVKCPGCASTFTAEAPPAEPPTPPSEPPPLPPPLPSAGQEETLNYAPPPPNLSLDDAAEEPPPRPPPLGTPQSVTPKQPGPAPEPAPSGLAAEEDLEPCPACGERIRKGLFRCPFCEEELRREGPARPEEGDERPWERGPRRRPVRRDC